MTDACIDDSVSIASATRFFSDRVDDAPFACSFLSLSQNGVSETSLLLHRLAMFVEPHCSTYPELLLLGAFELELKL